MPNRRASCSLGRRAATVSVRPLAAAEAVTAALNERVFQDKRSLAGLKLRAAVDAIDLTINSRALVRLPGRARTQPWGPTSTQGSEMPRRLDTNNGA